jgi:cytochrome P450
MKSVNEYPPGPSYILPYRLLRKFLRDPLRLLMDVSHTYGDIAHFKFGRQNVYLLNHPDYIEDVLVTNYKNFIKSRGLQVSKRLLGNGLVTSEGEYHDQQRRLIQPTFYPKRVKSYTDIMVKQALIMCNNWHDETILDIHKEMKNLTLAIICKTVLGYDVEPEHDEVGDSLLTCMKYFNRLLMPFGELIEKIPLLPINKGFQEAKSDLDSIVYRMIKEHRKKLDEGHEKQEDDDLLLTLLQAQDEEAGIGRMTDLQLRDEVMTIFLAGHETTTNALTWTYYLLSENPRTETRLQEELNSVFGNNRRTITVDDVPRLEYTEKILTESMRLYPPAWALGRQVIDDYKVGGYTIPKGSIILMSQYVMHHDPRYFSDPDRFYPERWTEDFKKQIPRFSYFPFGGGIRGCIGEPFAWLEAILLIATISRQWRMKHVPSHKVELKPLITLRPKYGMHMKITKI